MFGRKPIDVLDCVTELTNSIRDSPRASSAECLILRCDVAYSHKTAEVSKQLCIALGRPVNYREIPLKAEPPDRPVRPVAMANRRLETTDRTTEDVLLYVGSESLSLTNLLITHGSSEVLAFPSQLFR